MCGLIAAVWKNSPSPDKIIAGRDQMTSRGPDAAGVWESTRATLGHRRLAILDVDERSNQPFTFGDGRYRIVYNGEIYNFKELQRELQARRVALKTNSDTEVVVALYALHGPKFLTKLRGMYAIAIWDDVNETLFLARDPFGIKPLYYAQTAAGFLAASQVRSIVATGLVESRVDKTALMSFLRSGSVAEPRTWCQDVFAFPAGYWALAGARGFAQIEKSQDPTEFFTDQALRLIPEPAHLVPALVRRAVVNSVEAHAVSDVPVGLFLSGGIDSGVIAAILGNRISAAVTLSFTEFASTPHNEVGRAKSIAAQYGIPHHVRHIGKDEFLDDLPRIFESMDQPSIDGVNTWYASKAMSEIGIKVALSGVGADELFQGYSHFRSLPTRMRRFKQVSALPGGASLVRVGAALMAHRTNDSRWLEIPTSMASVSDAYRLQRSLLSVQQISRHLPGDGLIDPVPPIVRDEAPLSSTPELALSQLEISRYLRNQLLRDSDWASMAHSVELRTPFVDQCLVEDVSRALGSFRLFPGKTLLSAIPSPRLPAQVTGTSKTGFGIPISDWLKNSGSAPSEGKTWASTVLDEFALA